MKRILLLVLVLVSMDFTMADNKTIAEEQFRPSLTSWLDGTFEKKILGNQKNAANSGKKIEEKVCDKIYYGCLQKSNFICQLLPACRANYYSCRCIVMTHNGNSKGKPDVQSSCVKNCISEYQQCSIGKKYCQDCLKKLRDCFSTCPQSDKHMKAVEDEGIMIPDHPKLNDYVQQDESNPSLSQLYANTAQRACLLQGVTCRLRSRADCIKQRECGPKAKRCILRAHKNKVCSK